MRMMSESLDMPALLDVIATTSSRPRYAFMVLNLIAQAAGSGGSAGPMVKSNGGEVPVRDWLCDALTPMAHRDARRIKIAQQVRTDLQQTERLPSDGEAARHMVDAAIKERVREAGKTNISRAVSDLVRAGLLHRHYQGYRVDHANRGAQRQAVYTIAAKARDVLTGRNFNLSDRSAPELPF